MKLYKPQDYSEIKDWCFIRDIGCPPEWSLPETGLIVPEIACGFLIVTNNSMGILDFFISNPVSDKRIRDSALDLIVLTLCEMAMDTNLKYLKCDTQNPAIRERALKHGFNSVGKFDAFSKGI